MGFGDSTNADAFESREEAIAAVGGEAFVGDQEEEAEEKEVELRDDIPGEDGGRATAGESPEEKQGDDEWSGNCGCEGVGSLVVWEGGGGAGGVFDQ